MGIEDWHVFDGFFFTLFKFSGRAAISLTDVFSYDVAEDGKQFLVNGYVKPASLLR